MKITNLLCAAAAALATAACAASANATVYIGYSLNGGAITTLASDPSSVTVGSTDIGAWKIKATADAGIAPDILSSNTLDIASSDVGVLDIFVLRDGVTGPVPGFLTNFTEVNNLGSALTVQERSYVDATGSNVFGAGTQIGNFTFNSGNTPGASFQTSNFQIAGGSPYSVTERYTITATGRGTANAAMAVSAAPEPGAWALMLLGFGAAGAMLRTSRRRALAFA